eukprot:scaffold1658_cov248-Chaetoceros_neogracile.AAC.6
MCDQCKKVLNNLSGLDSVEVEICGDNCDFININKGKIPHVMQTFFVPSIQYDLHERSIPFLKKRINAVICEL